MKKEKRVMKRGKNAIKAYFLIVNLILASVAFSWMVGAQTEVYYTNNRNEVPPEAGNVEQLSDGTWRYELEQNINTQVEDPTYENVPDRDIPAEPPSHINNPPNVPVSTPGAVAAISTGGTSGSALIATTDKGETVLFDVANQDSIKVGTEGINLKTGAAVKVTDTSKLTNFKTATNIQSAYGKTIINMDGGKTTLANVIQNPALSRELANNPDLWSQLDGVKKVTFDNGKLVFDYGNGQTTSIAGGEITTTTKGSSMLSQFFGAAGGGGWDALLTGVEYAGLGWGAGQLIGSIAGMDEEQTRALSEAMAAGAFTAKSLMTLKTGWAHELLYENIPFDIGKLMLAHPIITGIIVGAIIFALRYKKTSTEVVSFECKPWQAPVGGEDCEKCNNVEGCSEYKCKSLGQACQLLNPGTGQEKCAWVNPRDTKSPGISPWEAVLTKGYKYTDVRIRPPGEGSEPGRMTIVKDDGGCVEAFTPLEFGIVTMGPDNIAEPAQCKIDYNHTLKYSDMAFDFGESNLYLYNHSQKLRLPSPASIQAAAPELKHDGTYTLYVRCRDANGNENVDEFAIRFCVDKGPDTTPPKIEGTSIANGMPVKYNQSSVELEVYVNEPAECKWSRDDKSYNNMENTMSCSTNVWEMNNNMVYTCKTTLTGIKNRQENKFYFRCKDQPWAEESERNVNMESYLFTLIGTEPLNIIDIKPNGTIKGSTDVVSVWLEVETANGYKNGEAICYYSETTNEADWIEFFETGTEMHKQRLDLISGSYKYYVKCVDLGGNRNDNFTEFTVEVDRSSPIIARVYKENELLKIITIEDSECRYSTQNCNFKFEDGIDMPYANQTEHVAEWKTENTYYIRCSDEYGNIPLSNACSMVVRPYDIVEQKVEE